MVAGASVVNSARIGGMSPDLEDSSGPGGQAVANDYDSFAEAYAAANESSLLNGYYARPAVLDLAGDVAGRRILDVGCGAGPCSRRCAMMPSCAWSCTTWRTGRHRSPNCGECWRLAGGSSWSSTIHSTTSCSIATPTTSPPREYSEEYTLSGQSVTLTYWHRPLHAMTDAFTEAGFRIAVVSEPPPAPGTRERFPWVFKDLPSATAFLCFLFFVLEAA